MTKNAVTNKKTGQKMHWKVNTPALLKEIVNNAPGTTMQGVAKPLEIFSSILAEWESVRHG